MRLQQRGTFVTGVPLATFWNPRLWRVRSKSRGLASWSRILRALEMTDSALIVRSTLYSRRTVVPQAGKICRDPRADARTVFQRMR